MVFFFYVLKGFKRIFGGRDLIFVEFLYWVRKFSILYLLFKLIFKCNRGSFDFFFFIEKEMEFKRD